MRNFEIGMGPPVITRASGGGLAKDSGLPPPKPIYDDESRAEHGNIKPLKEVFARSGLYSENHTPQIEKMLDYLSSTRDLEADSPRTHALEEIANKMLEGRDVKTKVYIMRKGTDKNAFVTADGSMFVSQALINDMGSIDELAGVIGHELGHLLNKTFETRIASHSPSGVGWIHETASDFGAPYLLEKAGLNSLALESAVSKVSSNERGFLHQTGEMRATQIVGMHMGVDFSTSDQEHQQMPQGFKTPELKKTNLEVVQEARLKGDLETLGAVVTKLHPSDLIDFYYFERGESLPGDRLEESITTVLRDEITRRFESVGFSTLDIRSFFLFGKFGQGTGFSWDFFEKPGDIVGVVEHLPEFGSSSAYQKMGESVFGKWWHEKDGTEMAERMGSVIGGKQFDPEYGDKKGRIPLDKEGLFKIIKVVHELPYQDKTFFSNELVQYTVISELLATYVQNNFVKDWSLTSEEQARAFLEDFKKQGIDFDLRLSSSYSLSSDVKKLMEEYFGAEKVEQTLFEEIDKTFNRFLEGKNLLSPDARSNPFIMLIEKRFKERDLGDAERALYVDYCIKKIDGLGDKSYWESGWGSFPARERSLGLDVENFGLLNKFMLKQAAVLGLMKEDGKEFYAMLDDLMKNSGVDTNKINFYGMINVTFDLLHPARDFHISPVKGFEGVSNYGFGGVRVGDFESLMSLPFIKDMIAKKPNVEFESFGSLLQMHQDLSLVCFDTGYFESVFDEDLYHMIVYEDFRQGFVDLLSGEIDPSQLGDLYDLMYVAMPEGSKRDEYCREINKLYLEDEGVSLAEKTDYLSKHFDRVGAEGMVIVADQIKTLAEWRYFSRIMHGRIEAYKQGSEFVDKVATVDFLTSKVAKKSETLFSTAKTDVVSKKKVSTDYANEWVGTYLEHSPGTATYNPETGRFELNDFGRQSFSTVADDFTKLHNFSPVRRFSMALKALVDQDGALITPEGRKVLGEILVSSLGGKTSFINTALKLAVEKAPEQYFGFSAAQMLAPLLFRGLEVGAVDTVGPVKKLKHLDIDSLKLRRIIDSTTRQITSYGDKYLASPGTLPARLIREDEAQYTLAVRELDRFLKIGNGSLEQREKGQLSLATEATIRAVEASGAIGVRSLQLARQLHKFSPEVDARLAQSFDSRPGLNKLLFWENFEKLAKGDDGLREFLEKDVYTVDEFLGGGSLYTTFAATIGEPDGEKPQERIVIKILNPNSMVFIKKTHEAAMDVLGEMVQNSKGADAKFAKMGLIFVDLSENWCRRDINDPNFEVDDDSFRETISRFNNAGISSVHVFAPQRVLTSLKVKSEQRAEGRTLNKFLADDAVSKDAKAQAVTVVSDFFAFQLGHSAGKTEKGEDIFLVHSDPHIGNYVVDHSGEHVKLGVIDRSMYLKLSGKQADVFSKLLNGGSYRDFAEPFIDLVLDENKVFNNVDRGAKKDRIMAGLKKEYAGQMLKSIKSLKLSVDNFALLRRFMGEMDAAGIEPSLEMRLMIRNVEAFKGLQRRYGVDKKTVKS